MSKLIKIKVKEVIQQTSEAVTIKFKKPFFKKIEYKPGQFLTVEVDLNGTKERRAYSLSSAINIDSELQVTVKKVANGTVSKYMNNNVKAGDVLTVIPPLGKFVHEVNKKAKRNILLFGGGSGITPLMAMLKSVLHFEKESKVALIYANKNTESIIFRKELQELKQKFKERFTLVHVLKNNDGVTAQYTGRINHDIIKSVVDQMGERVGYNSLFYICGPFGFMDTVKASLFKQGISEDKIHTESFTAALEEFMPKNEVARTIMVKLGKKWKELQVQPKVNVLAAMIKSGMNVQYSCGTGICGTCKCKLVEGEVDMSFNLGLTEDDKKNSLILPCVSFPISDNVKIDFNK